MPKADAAPQNRSVFSLVVREALVTSPLASTISIQLMVASKGPYRKDELSPEVPEKPPPTVMPGNSITTRGTRPALRVAATSASMGTFGSTSAVFLETSISSTRLRELVSTVLSRRRGEARVLFVEP